MHTLLRRACPPAAALLLAGALAAPVFAVGIGGHLPSGLLPTALLIGWLACAIPSPQDFSVAIYAHRALDVPPSPVATPVSHAD